jgi:hypothetical protein
MVTYKEAVKMAEKHMELADHWRKIAQLEGAEVSVQRRGRGRGRPKAENGKPKKKSGERAGSLPALLMEIAQKSKKPLKIEDFVTRVLEGGYKSDAKNFSNIVYQNLTKLVKSKRLEKEDKEYKAVAAA